MNFKRILFLVPFTILIISHLSAQQSNIQNGLSINEDGSDPDTSAILDIQSTDKGVLIPRLDTSDIAAPAKGLLIFQPSNNTFYFYNQNRWTNLLSARDRSSIIDTDDDTWVHTETNSDEDQIRFVLEGDEVLYMFKNGGGFTQFEVPNSHESVIIGEDAADALSSGSSNVIIGDASAESISSSTQNVIIGANASKEATNGGQTIIIGYEAAENSANNNQSTIIGFQAGQNASQLSNAILIGRRAGQNLQSGSGNIAIGFEAGMSMDGALNVAMGNLALRNNSGSHNVALGANAGFSASGDRNVLLGQLAGKVTEGDDNIYLGHQAGHANKSGNDNIAIGYEAGSGNIDGSHNIYIGEQAGLYDTASRNIIMGVDAAREGTGGDANIVIGDRAGIQSIPGAGSVVIGAEAASSSRVYSANLIMGQRAAYNLDTLRRSVILGGFAFSGGDATGSSEDNVIIGMNAARNGSAKIDENTLVGSHAAFNLDRGFRNVALGYFSAYEIEDGSDNIAIGNKSLRANTDGNENVVIGNEALENGLENASFAQYQNTAIGYQAAQDISGDANIALGYRAGDNIDTGNRNIYIGYEAGQKNLSGPSIGDDNIFIGNNTNYTPLVLGDTIRNSVAIGNNAELKNQNTIILGADDPNILIGIGTSKPQDKVDVDGNISCDDPLDEDHVVTLGYLLANYSGTPNYVHLRPDTVTNFSGAASYCRDLESDGFQNWRLPSLAELSHFTGINATNEEYWTVTPYSAAYSRDKAHAYFDSVPIVVDDAPTTLILKMQRYIMNITNGETDYVLPAAQIRIACIR